MHRCAVLILLTLLIGRIADVAAAEPIHHEMQVILEPMQSVVLCHLGAFKQGKAEMLENPKGFIDFFRTLPDHRINRKKLYPIEELLLITFCRVMAGWDVTFMDAVLRAKFS